MTAKIQLFNTLTHIYIHEYMHINIHVYEINLINVCLQMPLLTYIFKGSTCDEQHWIRDREADSKMRRVCFALSIMIQNSCTELHLNNSGVVDIKVCERDDILPITISTVSGFLPALLYSNNVTIIGFVDIRCMDFALLVTFVLSRSRLCRRALQ